MHAYSKRKKTRPHTKREKKKTQIIIKPSLMATKSKLAEAAATAQCVPSPGKSTSGGTRLLDGYSAPEVGKRRVGQSTKLSVVDHAKAELLLTVCLPSFLRSRDLTREGSEHSVIRNLRSLEAFSSVESCSRSSWFSSRISSCTRSLQATRSLYSVYSVS